MTTTFFFYGTLRHRPMLELVSGGTGGAVGREAALPDHRLLRSAEGDLPVLVEEPGRRLPGLLWDLPDEARERLDAYELPFGYRRRTIRALAEGGPVEAQAYFPPESLEASGEEWSFEAWLRDSLPPPMRGPAGTEAPGAGDGGEGPMADHRAAAAGRATGRPTTRRHRAGPGDFGLRRSVAPAGRFFLFEALEVEHRRFDGARNEGLAREVLVGADAALVLPYDAARDRVLLVEQFRPGPARRGDPQPWVLEPVAGLVDAGETPEEAARREAEEEANLTLGELLRMFEGYASPGNATDHFYAYLALCDLPEDAPAAGGLEDEKEDLRLHVLPFGEAMGLIGTGEANAMPLISMLLWLDRWRAGRR